MFCDYFLKDVHRTLQCFKYKFSPLKMHGITLIIEFIVTVFSTWPVFIFLHFGVLWITSLLVWPNEYEITFWTN